MNPPRFLPLYMALGVLAIAAGAWHYVRWASRPPSVEAIFIVSPGGKNVVVMLDGQALQASIFGEETNHYHEFFPLGKHVLTVSKPGYESQREEVVIKSTDAEWYNAYTLRPDANRHLNSPSQSPNTPPKARP